MLDVLRHVIQEVNSARNLNTALDIIVDRVQKAMGTEVCSVYLLDNEGKRYVFMATRGLNAAIVGNMHLGLNEGLVGLVGERAEPINLHNAAKHPRYHHVAELGEEQYRAFLGVPIIHYRKVLGVIVVQQTSRRRFNSSEESFLITLSAQLAGVIAHAKAAGDLSLVGKTRHLPATQFEGKSGAPGAAIGRSVVVYPEADLYKVPERTTAQPEAEIAAFRAAVAETRNEIQDMSEELSARLQPEELALFDAYQHMLDETAIAGEVIELIRQGIWNQTALRQVIESHVATFNAMDNRYLRERGTDVLDLGQRVLAKLQTHRGQKRHYPSRTVLVADKLTPAMLADVPRRKLRGLVSVRGSGNSHVAILAKAMGVPTVMGVEDLPLDLLAEKPVIVDGFEGCIITHPNKEQVSHYRTIIKEEAAFNQSLAVLKDKPAITVDGKQVRLWVNTGLMTDVARSLAHGAEGVGLYRTELHFMMADRFPTEAEQRAIYRKHIKAFAPLPVTMRTLDIGGDKALSYFPITEENPFLGWRGIRVTLDHPEIFLSQVRAMIHANAGIDTDLRIMLPMISSIAEVDESQRLISQCYREIIEEGVEVEKPDVGVMIEIPAVVYQAREIAKRVDFLSVGSNDLIQYMLAVDRNNSRVAELYQDFHPAVLHALQQVVIAGHAEHKPVSICGEMAGKPGAAILLAAMGFDILSMNTTNLLPVKWAIRSFTMVKAKQVLASVLTMDNAFLIKQYVEAEMIKAGLKKLIRTA